ncbi:L-threonylcarbamoyladenylate synthase [Capillimicrobium parvum]|uniref:L-threonylcarbamoyladenylate synthase n=1 Tax=Capillimicrobium parvum TaxID=2884022 RepID=A0A9E6XV68_9ACTN|nr:Sua5/YciO/YrdC/YwlC family protein [Capillimicrobium parvum]UGS35049.1 Threonylcarbamoyl-AMP synthase [Capillimicrobium parvum]
MLTASDAATFERCMAVGGIALFPADTVYGFACDARTRESVERLYLLKRRPLSKPSAVMLFSLELALAAVPELGPRTRSALEALLPGGVTLLLANPAHRFPLACGDDPETLGLRVPALPPAADALGAVNWPILQSSANRAGEPEARTVGEVPAGLREAADLVLDAGPLPGTPSTVVDLRRFEARRQWSIARAGAVGEDVVDAALAAL